MEIHREFTKELARRLSQPPLFIQAVIGPRQVGKTTGTLSLQNKLQLPIFYCTADSPVAPGYEWLREQWISARAQSLDYGGVIILDEVQKIAGWSEVVKEFFDEERRRPRPLHVVLLGSASWKVQSGLSESLAGRFEIIQVPHWSLAESRGVFGWNLDTYLKFGGYPAPAALINEVSRWQQFIRDSVIEPMISRDLLTLREVAKPALFRQCLQLALNYPAQEISLQKLLGQLQDRGNSTTIKGYLELLQAGSVLSIVPKFSTRPLSVKSSSPKLVPMCTALLHAFNPPERLDTDAEWRGRVFEAAIGAKLIVGLGPDAVYYWREHDREVDYVLQHRGELVAVEVKSGRKKQSGGLEAFRMKFAGARTVAVDRNVGEKLLDSQNPWEFLKLLL